MVKGKRGIKVEGGEDYGTFIVYVYRFWKEIIGLVRDRCGVGKCLMMVFSR